MSTNKMDTSAVFEMFETLNKKLDIIHVDNKAKDNQQVNQSVSKEEIEAIVKDYQAKTLSTILNTIDKKMSTFPVSQSISFSQPKKIAFFGFEFLRTSVVIFILSSVIFWSLVMNIKQMDNNEELKTKNNQLTEYIQHLGKTEKEKSIKLK